MVDETPSIVDVLLGGNCIASIDLEFRLVIRTPGEC